MAHRIVSAFAIAAFAVSAPAHAGQVWLTMDQVRPYLLETPATEIVVGNPGIADVTVQDKSRLLLFGKSPGYTNIFIFGEDGKVIEDLKIRVETVASGALTLNRGAARTTYNCTRLCEVTPTVGDDNATFQAVIQQAQSKFDQATASAGNN